MYRLYKGEETLSSGAHFEPGSGRLVIHDSCDHETMRHEATHQSMWGWTKPAYAWPLYAYWFQEGIADWYGTSKRSFDEKTQKWGYVLGKVNAGHVKSLIELRANKFQSKKLFGLKELIKTRYANKQKIIADGRELLILSLIHI